MAPTDHRDEPVRVHGAVRGAAWSCTSAARSASGSGCSAYSVRREGVGQGRHPTEVRTARRSRKRRISRDLRAAVIQIAVPESRRCGRRPRRGNLSRSRPRYLEGPARRGLLVCFSGAVHLCCFTSSAAELAGFVAVDGLHERSCRVVGDLCTQRCTVDAGEAEVEAGVDARILDLLHGRGERHEVALHSG